MNSSPFWLVTTGTYQMRIVVIEQTDQGLPHLEGFANVEKVGILGERVAEHAQLQRQLVRDPTHLIHPGFSFPFLKDQETPLQKSYLNLANWVGGTGRPSSHARAAAV